VLGSIVNKEKEVDQWIADYNKKSDQVWKDFKQAANIGPDETATIYYALNKRLFVQTTGFAGNIYSTNGFKMQAEVKQATIDQALPWAEISFETIPTFAGDHVFLIGPTVEGGSDDEITRSAVWSNLPAVKNGSVALIDKKWDRRDAFTMNRVLDELPTIIKKK